MPAAFFFRHMVSSTQLQLKIKAAQKQNSGQRATGIEGRAPALPNAVVLPTPIILFLAAPFQDFLNLPAYKHSWRRDLGPPKGPAPAAVLAASWKVLPLESLKGTTRDVPKQRLRSQGAGRLRVHRHTTPSACSVP